LAEFPYVFPDLPKATFWGLPGLLADSLPDKFGNAMIDEWLASTGRSKDSFNPVERLCYIGNRGMGGLEYRPALRELSSKSKAMEVANLLELANKILNRRASLAGAFTGDDDREALEDILRVGSSAGGARPKAILAWNPKTNEFRSGQLKASMGFEYWILKFDGINEKGDQGLSTPKGYGKIEYAYHQMAVEAGIEMTRCRLYQEGGRSHFMIKRFDRDDDGNKIHRQTLCAMAHVDYNQPALYSYEQAIQTMKQLRLPHADLVQQVYRAMFNVVGRNQDDHVKNIEFLMNRGGEWRLSPAYDISYSFNPTSYWIGNHQMSINGKLNQFTKEDLFALASIGGIKSQQAAEMLERVTRSIRTWPEKAAEMGIDEKSIRQIEVNQRLFLLN